RPKSAKKGKASEKAKPDGKVKPDGQTAPKTTRVPGERGGYPLTAKITVLKYGGKGENPHKANSEGGGIRYLAWESVKRAATVADYVGKPKNLKRRVDAGLLRIDLRSARAAHSGGPSNAGLQ